MLLDLFIKAGWYTVPLKGELKRLENGKKTIPIFENNWRLLYAAEQNKEGSALAGTLTGKKSGIIAIDCDNDLTYSMFKQLDPDYNFHFVSKGKPQGGGTIIYKYNEELNGFKLNTDNIALDFYSDNGFVYLPTEHNYTKKSWENVKELPKLSECPPTILAMLNAFKLKSSIVKDTETKYTISNRLAPLLEVFVKGKKYDPVLFRIITPYSFRDLPQYASKGHVHPNDVPKGRGSEYLSKISAILGADISVSKELYTNVMLLINTLWIGEHRPKPKEEMLITIINPMIEERAAVNDKIIWQYDPHWEKMGFIATTLNGDYIESFYDDIKGLYYLVNYTIPYVRMFGDKHPLVSSLRALLGRTISEVQYDSVKQLVRTHLNPSLEFGHVANSDKFNLFRQTPELRIINNPEPYRSQYVRPTTIIRYFESLIPDDYIRGYILSFLKTKLTTFKYSPVVLYLIGKPGSGKDTLVGIIRKILGDEYVAKPDTKVFLEQYNGWMIDKFLIQLDEYGDKLVRHADKQEALGKIKAITGAPNLQIRAMRADGYNYLHSTTFIMTANKNPLPVELDDRRFCFAKTPNKLEREEWVIQAGGITEIQNAIAKEIQDFCYYLATEIKALPFDNYMIAPDTSEKEALILEGLPAAEKIVYYINNGKFSELAKLAVEYGIDNFTYEWDRCRLLDDKIKELYDVMTEGNGQHTTIIRMLKGIGIIRGHTTKNRTNVFYYYINDLHKFKNDIKQDYEESIVEAKESGIKGLS